MDHTHDAYRLTIGKRKAFIDLGAEMPLAAEKDGRKIAVEVKSFLGASTLDDLENALGNMASIELSCGRGSPIGICISRSQETFVKCFLTRRTFA